MTPADFRVWHETDLQRCPQFGRYRGESGHGGYERRLPKLTHKRHWGRFPVRLLAPWPKRADQGFVDTRSPGSGGRQ